MAYVIAEPCIGTKDTACVDACPVDCIHPKKDEDGHAEADQLFIDPVECIDCGACVPACRRRTSSLWPTISPPMASSRIATPASCWSRSASTQARSLLRRTCCPFRAEFSPRSMSRFTKPRPRRASRTSIASSSPAAQWSASTTRHCRKFSTPSTHAMPTSASNSPPTAAARWSSVASTIY